MSANGKKRLLTQLYELMQYEQYEQYEQAAVLL